MLQILWESIAAQHALDSGVNSALSLILLGLEVIERFFFLYTCNSNLAKESVCRESWNEISTVNYGYALDGGNKDSTLLSTLVFTKHLDFA